MPKAKFSLVAACYFLSKPKRTTEMFVRQLCRVVEYVTDDFDDTYIIATGDFNCFNTDILVTGHGFKLLTNTATDSSKVLDRIFVNWPSTSSRTVANSLIKAK
jgi:hypothetical protein